MKTELSVIVTTYNHEKYLRECLVSLLNEKIDNLEIVVVDDCSTDGTVSTIGELPVQLLRNPVNRGIAYCRNLGLKQATGEFVTFFDSDNVLVSGGLARRVAWLREHPEEDIVGGIGGSTIDSDGDPALPISLGEPPDRLTLSFFQHGGRYCCATWLYVFRREVLDGFAFDEQLRVADDCDFMFRLLKRTTIPIIPVPVLSFRVHSGNTSIRSENSLLVYPNEVVAEALLVNISHGIVPSGFKV